MSERLRHIVQSDMGWLLTSKFQTQVSMGFSVSVAFVSVSIVIVAGLCKATGLPFVWVFSKNWISDDWSLEWQTGLLGWRRGRFNSFL